MPKSTLKTRVIKLGGSRLPAANLKTEIACWLSIQSSARNIWVVGGGNAVEQLRRRDRTQNLNANAVHWEAIRIMDENATVLSRLFPDWPLAEKVAATNNCQLRAINQIVLVSNWLSTCEQPLPMTWDVTSDSIAAVIARRARADELVLLKSTDPPSDGTIESAIKASFVDAYFETAVAEWKSGQSHSRIRIVNMAASDFREFDLTF